MSLYWYKDACKDKSWAWKQGWLYGERYQICNNPHLIGTRKYDDFAEGCRKALFLLAVEGGWYDW